MSASPDPLDTESRVAAICAEATIHGIVFDMARGRALQATWQAEAARMKADFAALFPPLLVRREANFGLTHQDGAVVTAITWKSFNPNSSDDVAREALKRGFVPEDWTDTGKPRITDDILGVMPWPELREIAKFRKLVKNLGMVTSYIEKTEDDDRIHHTIHTIGCVTSRMSHSNPNLAQVPKADILRQLFTAAPGWVLVGVDADAIEARLLASAITPFDGGRLITILETGAKKRGTDFHSLNQRAVGLYSRDSAKTLIYALLYGAGYAKLGTIVAEDAIAGGKPPPPSLEAAGRAAKERLMQSIHGFKALRDHLVTGWQRAGHILACDGRRLFPEGSHVVLNTLFQGNGAIAMKVALVLAVDALAQRGIEAHHVLNVHDEMIFETRPDDAEAVKQIVIDSIEEAGRRLGFACPLRANGAIGPNWGAAK